MNDNDFSQIWKPIKSVIEQGKVERLQKENNRFREALIEIAASECCNVGCDDVAGQALEGDTE